MRWYTIIIAALRWSSTSAVEVWLRDAAPSTTPESISEPGASASSCGADCQGSIYITVYVTGVAVDVDGARTTAPPNCNADASSLGAGYSSGQQTTIWSSITRLGYALEDGHVTEASLSDDTISNDGLTSSKSNLAEYSGQTVACLSSAYALITGYYSDGAVNSDNICQASWTQAQLTPFITFTGTDITTVSSSTTFLAPFILTRIGTTSCNVFSPTTQPPCSTTCNVDLGVSAVWVGVPLTYDVKQVTMLPNCEDPLKELGAGYTGSTTFTTLTYSAGNIGLASGTGSIVGYSPTAYDTVSTSDGGLITVDGQTIGCLTSLYYFIQDYTLTVDNDNCEVTHVLSQTFPLQTIVTDSGQQPFAIGSGSSLLLASNLRTQLKLPCNAAAVVTSSTKPASSPTLIQPSTVRATIIPLKSSSTGLSNSGKIGIATAIGAAAALIIAFLTFAVWRRSFASRNEKFDRLSGRKSLIDDNLNARDALASVQRPNELGTTVNSREKSWRAPLFMLTGFSVGLLLSLGHHFFYTSLDGRPTQDVQMSQSWVLRLGNLFAFLAKLSLSISVGTAFVQLQWVKLRQRPLRVRDVDSLSGILDNVFNFRSSYIWRRYPMVTLLAVLFWLLPITPIITPGTINVFPEYYLNMTSIQVPELAVDSLQWTDFGEAATAPRPNTTLARIVNAASMLKDILPINIDQTNVTYQLGFFAPALKCQNADSASTLNASKSFGYIRGEPPEAYAYYSWVPGANLTDPSQEQCGTDQSHIDVVSQDHSRLFIMTNDDDAGPLIPGTNRSFVNLTECGLYNATYSVNFTFNNAQPQVIDILDIHYLEGISCAESLGISDLTGVVADPSYLNQIQAYAGLMGAFGSLFVGSILVGDNGDVARNCTRFDDMEIDPNLDIMQRTIEEIFQNATLSLLSQEIYRKNASQAHFVPANITIVLTTYTYDSFDLLLTYGLALLATLVASLVGFNAFLINNASYQNRFSTFIRAMHNSELPVENDDIGSDPRPEDLGRAMVVMMPESAAQVQTSSYNPAEQHLIPRKPVASAKPWPLD